MKKNQKIPKISHYYDVDFLGGIIPPKLPCRKFFVNKAYKKLRNLRFPKGATLFGGEFERQSLSNRNDVPKILSQEEKNFSATLYGLDRQAYIFLTKHYAINILHREALEAYLLAWQYESLLKTLTQAKSTPFYRDKIDSTNYATIAQEFQSELTKHRTQKTIPNKQSLQKRFHTLLESLPTTLAQDIAQNADAFLAISQDDIESIISVKTSGSSSRSGESSSLKRIYCSASDLESTIDFYFYGMENVFMPDVQMPDVQKVAMLMSSERVGNVGHLMKEAMKRKNIPCEIIGFSYDYDMLIEKLIAFQPTCIIAIPWHIFALSQQIAYYAKESQKIQKVRQFVTSILLSGDTCSESMKAQISHNFDCPVFRHFGMTEFGLGGAVECKEHKAMHVRGLDTYIEIIKPSLNSPSFLREIISPALRSICAFFRSAHKHKRLRRPLGRKPPYQQILLNKAYKNLQNLRFPKGVTPFGGEFERQSLSKNKYAQREYGEIVVTSLSREAMPLIRYRTGDFGRLRKTCSCQSIMQNLEVLGRMEQGLLLKNYFVHLSDFQDIFCTFAHIQDFDIAVHSFNYKSKSQYIIVFIIHFLKLSFLPLTTMPEENGYQKKKEEDIKKEIMEEVASRISKRFSLQYLEKNTMLEEIKDLSESKPYKPNIPLEYFCLLEAGLENTERSYSQFPKKKIQF